MQRRVDVGVVAQGGVDLGFETWDLGLGTWRAQLGSDFLLVAGLSWGLGTVLGG